jgi:hypothetical protein
VALFLVAQYPSESEGEPATAWDWIRHGVCFLAGSLLAAGLVRGFGRGRRLGAGTALLSIVVGVLLTLFAQFPMENGLFDEGTFVAGVVPIWLIRHTLIFIGGLACYAGVNRFTSTDR